MWSPPDYANLGGGGEFLEVNCLNWKQLLIQLTGLFPSVPQYQAHLKLYPVWEIILRAARYCLAQRGNRTFWSSSQHVVPSQWVSILPCRGYWTIHWHYMCELKRSWCNCKEDRGFFFTSFLFFCLERCFLLCFTYQKVKGIWGALKVKGIPKSYSNFCKECSIPNKAAAGAEVENIGNLKKSWSVDFAFLYWWLESRRTSK